MGNQRLFRQTKAKLKLKICVVVQNITQREETMGLSFRLKDCVSYLTVSVPFSIKILGL